MDYTVVKEEYTVSPSSSVICRLCLVEGSKYFNIFDENYKGPEIVDTLRNLLGVSISPVDNWPKSMCTFCVEKVQNIQTLLTQIQHNEERLRDMFGEYRLQDEKPDINFTCTTNVPEFIEPEVKEENVFCSLQDPIDEDLNEMENSTDAWTDDVVTAAEPPSDNKPKKRGRPTKPKKIPEKKEKVKPAIPKKPLDAAIQEFYKMDCVLCNISFDQFSDVQEHFRTEHQSRGYIVCCGKKLNSPRKLLYHMNLHINPVKHQCSVCLKYYKTEDSLLTHKKLQHTPMEERQFCCDKCPKRFALVGALTAHMLTHLAPEEKKHICKTCGQAFALNTILVQHVRRVHENAYVSVCDICAKVFRTKSLFERHVQEHTAQIKPTIPCTTCGKMFKNRVAMRRHMRRHNTSGSLACSICGHVSTNQQALREHIKHNHTLRKTFECSLCEAVFRSRVSLKEHMASHTGQVLYNCRYCSKQFNSNANYFRHTKVSHPIEWEAEKKKKLAKVVYLKPENKKE